MPYICITKQKHMQNTTETPRQFPQNHYGENIDYHQKPMYLHIKSRYNKVKINTDINPVILVVGTAFVAILATWFIMSI